ncbi:MAG: septation protein SpoVG family protein [Candidatus Omnitrophica bacterium]|nr:septation protein SpoVG family protein [Candidatus Omnitrophota bacterium]MDD5236696.1 septation protein SpoVG family protein [Candidatus Omnitrophota bacterium]MDD5610091.1 septation protein SpoVG family protein [Candidatus Omnitrophota bacterium]
MEITEVRIFPKDSPDKKLRAYATVTFDNVFVVRNIKVIEGSTGLFIAMPSRKVKHPCPKCNFKNESKSKYCNMCAAQLPLIQRPVTPSDVNNLQSEHKDIAHPITQTFREYLQKTVLEAYEKQKTGTGMSASSSPSASPSPSTNSGFSGLAPETKF